MTNPVDRGTQAARAGSVTITWAVTQGTESHLHLQWQERDGPPVAPPTRRGFGTRLIERSLAQDLGGDVRVSDAPAGVVCTMDVPLDSADGGAEAEGS